MTSCRTWTLSAALMCTVAILASCTAETGESSSLTLLAYDSFTIQEDAFREFTETTGIRVEIALGGDAGELAAKAALTAGNPEGDVLWGVDNALLTRLLEADVFEPYVSTAAPITDELLESSRGIATPVDFGYVCINYDVERLERMGIEPPLDFQDLLRPEYAGMLVVPNPTSSSPGLAFLLATYASFGDRWSAYWRDLVANDVVFARGWTDAYYTWFSRHGGDRPLVVSYSTSPPAEVLYADPPLAEGAPAPTGVVERTCFEQIEFAGVLRGTEKSSDARRLVDFLVSREFQEKLPETLFVYPANSSASLPDSFVRYTVPVSDPWTLTPEEIDRVRMDLLDEWSRITGQ